MDERLMNWIQNETINTNNDKENEVLQENEDEHDKDYQERTKKSRKSETAVLELSKNFMDDPNDTAML